jgi:hypothetical protein
MKRCNGCPFLIVDIPDDEEHGETFTVTWFCNIKHNVDLNPDTAIFLSPDCQLEIVQYALKDKPDSVSFRPQEVK